MKRSIILGATFLLVTGVGLGLFENLAKAQSSKVSEPPVLQRHHVTPWTPTEPVDPRQLVPAAPTISLVPGVWNPIGPAPLNSGPSLWGNVSGRMTAIAAHPTDPLTIFIAAAGGGVWKTVNGGTSWTALTDTQQTISMGAIAI